MMLLMIKPPRVGVMTSHRTLGSLASIVDWGS